MSLLLSQRQRNAKQSKNIHIHCRRCWCYAIRHSIHRNKSAFVQSLITARRKIRRRWNEQTSVIFSHIRSTHSHTVHCVQLYSSTVLHSQSWQFFTAHDLAVFMAIEQRKSIFRIKYEKRQRNEWEENPTQWILLSTLSTTTTTTTMTTAYRYHACLCARAGTSAVFAWC